MGQFSITAMKEIRRKTKNELVDLVVKLNNYGEMQKAQNIILLKMVEDLKTELSKSSESNKKDAKND